MSDKILVSELCWDIKPPYHHWISAELTYRQYEKYRRLSDYKSLSAGTEYLEKISKKNG